ncbi:MAG: hypothetical protein NZO16_01970 [Deltaproteobacteria bacterium]|nr:hypothetical protein [Deltaproteobacteria bacterium]
MDHNTIEFGNYFPLWRRYAAGNHQYVLPSGNPEKKRLAEKVLGILMKYNQRTDELNGAQQQVSDETISMILENLINQLPAVGVQGCNSLINLLTVGVYELKRAVLEQNVTMYFRTKEVVVGNKCYMPPDFRFSKVYDLAPVSVAQDTAPIFGCFVEDTEWNTRPDKRYPSRQFGELEGGIIHIFPRTCL